MREPAEPDGRRHTGALRDGVAAVVLGGVALAAGAGLLGLEGARRGKTTTVGPSVVTAADGSDRAVLHVPRAPSVILLDGDTDDPGWTESPGPARTGPLIHASGVRARPHSDARLLWGDGQLYVALYAADHDIRSPARTPDAPLWTDDSFRLLFSRGDVDYVIEVSPRAVVTDAVRRPGEAFDYAWNSGAHVASDRDGTLDDPRDSDEEWVVELAVPLASLGLQGKSGERLGLAVRRCDVSADGTGSAVRSCAGWGERSPRGEIVLD